MFCNSYYSFSNFKIFLKIFVKIKRYLNCYFDNVLLKMQVKFLKSIVEHLINKPSVLIVDLLVNKKDVNEFLIAKKLELTINQTRNILYKLSDYGLVSFIRKKDKRKGWYIYFWTLNVYQSLNLLEEKMTKELEHLEAQLKSRREKRYYLCNTCTIEVAEDAALLNDFTCPECEEIYELNEDAKILEQLEKEISRIKKELVFVSKEKEIESEKLEKKKAKKIKKSEDEKKAKRAEKRKLTMKAKAKEKKKLEKKKPAKKKPAKKKAVKKKPAKKKPAKKKAVKKKPAKKKKK
jgi:transcription factor E